MCTKICDGAGVGYAMARHRLALVYSAGQGLNLRSIRYLESGFFSLVDLFLFL